MSKSAEKVIRNVAANPNNEAEVRSVIVKWTEAISKRDRKGILANHAQNILMFDIPKPIPRDLKAYDQTWDFFFADSEGAITFDPIDLTITAGDEVAFASCLIHCDGTTGGIVDLRLTIGLQKNGSEWVINHEHHSMPSQEDRFSDPTLR